MKFLVLFAMFFSTQLFANQQFGKGADMSKLVPISKLISDANQYKDKEVTVSGTIVSVCKKRGCWMKFSSDKKYQTLRIKVEDGKMIFPVSLRGKKGYATGKLQSMVLPVEKARKYLAHMAHESGQKFDPQSITGPYTIHQLVPVGVTVE